MIDTALRICQKFDYSIDNIDKSLDLSDIIDSVERKLIDGAACADPRRMMAELWSYRNRILSEEIQQSDEFKNRLEAIRTHPSFKVIGSDIVCNQFIPCSIIHTNRGSYILNSLQIDKLTRDGYGISNFRVRKQATIQEVYCDGKHPNLDKHSKQFCLDTNFLNSELNLQNLLFVMEMVSQINMRNTYCTDSERETILEAMNVGS
jgi:hypothetical protein